MPDLSHHLMVLLTAKGCFIFFWHDIHENEIIYTSSDDHIGKKMSVTKCH